jgi:predicted dehydrogenase
MSAHAVVGTGYWGSNHVRVAAELMEAGEIEKLVLCDLPGSGVEDMARNYDAEHVHDYHKLPSIGVETATIATPSPTHHDIATDLLEHGVDCLVEKPLALTSENAWDMVNKASEQNRTLGVGHIFRHHPALCDLKRRIDRGELGELKYVITNRFAFRAPRTSTGVLYSLAVHDVDIYNMLLDDHPDSIYCRMDSFVSDGIDESATLVMGYGDITTVMNESWQLPVFGKRRDIAVVGTRRAAYIDYLEDSVVELYDARVVRDQGVLHAVDEGATSHNVRNYEPLKNEVEDFLRASEAGEAPIASGQIGAKTVELLEIAERSAETGDAIHLA